MVPLVLKETPSAARQAGRQAGRQQQRRLQQQQQRLRQRQEQQWRWTAAAAAAATGSSSSSGCGGKSSGGTGQLQQQWQQYLSILLFHYQELGQDKDFTMVIGYHGCQMELQLGSQPGAPAAAVRAVSRAMLAGDNCSRSGGSSWRNIAAYVLV
jgi:hypothetical protein